MATYNRKDSYYKQAKQEGFKSRAAYKLLELDKKYNLIKKGQTILDCGAAPGGWSQVVLKKLNGSGKLVAIDLNEITDIKGNNFTFIKGDFTEVETLSKLKDFEYNLIISDIAPHTIGIREVDHQNSLEFCNLVAELAREVLKKGGDLLFKLFEGEGRKPLIDSLKQEFQTVSIVKPDATRQGSVEIYIYCKNKI